MSDLNMIYPAEWAAIGVGIFCFVVDFVAMGIALWSRNYPPLKVKQLHLVFFSIVCKSFSFLFFFFKFIILILHSH